MSLIKAYYITTTATEAGYTYDGTDFVSLPAIPAALNNTNGCVGVDPNNGNRVIFAAGDASSTSIAVSDDSGETVSLPAGDWNTFDIICDGGKGARIIVIDSLVTYIYGTAGVYKSIDADSSYSIINSTFADLVSFPINFVKMYMSDEFNGVLGLSNPGSTDLVKLFKTTDGCVTWTPITGFDSLQLTDPICGLYISPNGNTLIVVGKSKIYRSTNAGVAWSTALSFSAVNTSVYGSALEVVNASSMYALGGNNTIYKSVDSGATWTTQSSAPGIPNSHLLSFYSETEGYSSRIINLQNVILRTIDSGVTWTQIDTLGYTPIDLQSVSYNCGECPDGFIKTDLDQCDGKSLGPDLCPTGFQYNVATNRCECKGECDCPPTEVIFVVDNGSSVSINEINQLKDFLNATLDNPNVQDLAITQQKLKIGLVVFNIDANETSVLSTDIGTPGDTLAPIRQAINAISDAPQTGTNTAAGLAVAGNAFFTSRTAPGYNASTIQKIILVTDGWPNGAENAGVGAWSDVITVNATSPRTYTCTSDKAGDCGERTLGFYSDCDRCCIYNRTLEIGDDLKNIDGVYITVAILAEVFSTNLNDVLTTTALNPGSAPSIEAYMTYRSLITGYLDQQTHIFPPSADPTNANYYVSTGYGPASPEVGGWLNLSGLTGVEEGIPFGRILYGLNFSTSNISVYTTSPFITQWPALPNAYAGLNSGTTSAFQPFGLWNCNVPEDDPNIFAPLCSYKSDGITLDVYVDTFANAAISLAENLATSICNVAIDIDCGDCNPVQVGTNARCECEKTLFILPCVYKVYDCSDLTTPVYCTQEDLGAYVGSDIVVRITVDGSEVQGCYQIGISDVDYCQPLDQTIVTVTESYTSCAECQPDFVRLTSCNNDEIYIQVESTFLMNNIGKAIELLEYPGLCWRVDLEPTFPTITATVNIKQIYDDCECCKQYSCNP